MLPLGVNRHRCRRRARRASGQQSSSGVRLARTSASSRLAPGIPRSGGDNGAGWSFPCGHKPRKPTNGRRSPAIPPLRTRMGVDKSDSRRVHPVGEPRIRPVPRAHAGLFSRWASRPLAWATGEDRQPVAVGKPENHPSSSGSIPAGPSLRPAPPASRTHLTRRAPGEDYAREESSRAATRRLSASYKPAASAPCVSLATCFNPRSLN